jgi:anti-anti-sigma factor
MTSSNRYLPPRPEAPLREEKTTRNEPIVVSLSERTLVYRPSGTLDVTTAANLRDALDGARSKTEIVVDLSAVTDFDANGLGGLIRALRRIQWSGRAVRILDPSPHLAAMLSLSGIDRVARIEMAEQAPVDTSEATLLIGRVNRCRAMARTSSRGRPAAGGHRSAPSAT